MYCEGRRDALSTKEKGCLIPPAIVGRYTYMEKDLEVERCLSDDKCYADLINELVKLVKGVRRSC